MSRFTRSLTVIAGLVAVPLAAIDTMTPPSSGTTYLVDATDPDNKAACVTSRIAVTTQAQHDARARVVPLFPTAGTWS